MPKVGKALGLPIVNARAAGDNIRARIQVAAVPPELSDDPVRTFGSFTADIETMTNWLVSVGITTVAIESTAVHWVPVYGILGGILRTLRDDALRHPEGGHRGFCGA